MQLKGANQLSVYKTTISNLISQLTKAAMKKIPQFIQDDDSAKMKLYRRLSYAFDFKVARIDGKDDDWTNVTTFSLLKELIFKTKTDQTNDSQA